MPRSVWFSLSGFFVLVSIVSYPRTVSDAQTAQPFVQPLAPVPEPISVAAPSAIAEPVPPPPIPIVEPPPVQPSIVRLDNKHILVTMPRTQDWFDTGIPHIAEQAMSIGIYSPSSPTQFKYIAKLAHEDRVYFPESFRPGQEPFISLDKLADVNTPDDRLYARGDLFDTVQLKIVDQSVASATFEFYFYDENWGSMGASRNFWTLRREAAIRFQQYLNSLPVR